LASSGGTTLEAPEIKFIDEKEISKPPLLESVNKRKLKKRLIINTNP